MTVNLPVARPMHLHRPLVVLAALTGVLAVVLLPAMALDDRQLSGVSVWLKPWKFSVSIALYSLTVAWLVTLVRRGARLARAAASGAAVALGVEIAIITVQAARGVPSHFNNQTELDSTLFSIMGASIILVWVATLLLALLLMRQRTDDRVQAAGLRWGLGVSLLGMILAVLMINPVNQWMLRVGQYPQAVLDGGHTVGASDGGPGLPVTNWSLQAGDLRAPHFVGIHALQLLPLLAWLLCGHARRLGAARQVGLVHVAGVGYLGLVVLLGWQALRGEPVTRPGAATLAAAGVLLLAGVGAAVAVMMGAGHGGASRPARAPGPGAPEPMEPAPAAPTGPHSLHGQGAATAQPPQADRPPPDA